MLVHSAIIAILFSALYSLERDWRDIVKDSDLLSRKQTKQQTALWELAETEVTYIKTLKVVTDVSKKKQRCLCEIELVILID